MLKKIVKIIHQLRLFFIGLIFILFFSYLGLNPIDVGRYVGSRFSSAVGMSTSVPDNPFNRLASQLKSKEDSLNEREKELAQKEVELMNQKPGSDKILLLILEFGIIILFILLLVNYYLDYKNRKFEQKKSIKDLK